MRCIVLRLRCFVSAHEWKLRLYRPEGVAAMACLALTPSRRRLTAANLQAWGDLPEADRETRTTHY